MATKKENNVLKKVLWFGNRIRFDLGFTDLLRPRREVSHDARFHSGLYRSAKCGRDIQYESALELRFIRLLETDPQVAFYWEQPVKLSYRRGRRPIGYTPDFGIWLRSGHFLLAEVKELAEMLDYRVQQKTEALMAFCRSRGFGLLLTDGRRTPKDLLKAKANRKLERELLAALGRSPVRQPQCREIMQRCHALPGQLHKAVIRLDLRFRHFPLKIERGNDCRIFCGVFFRGKAYDAPEDGFETAPSDQTRPSGPKF